MRSKPLKQVLALMSQKISRLCARMPGRTPRTHIDRCGSKRHQHRDYVFSYKGKRITRIMNSAWLRARNKADLPHLRVHDLKHTYGRRLRAAGVSFEDRQDLLGHRSGRITTHYSAAELSRLLGASERVCDRGKGRPELVVLRRLAVS